MKIMKAEHGTGALLEQVALGDVNVDDWSEGILAIGTFGYDPSPVGFNQQLQFHSFENEEELEIERTKEDSARVETIISDVEGEEHNHLVLNASESGVSNKDIVRYQDQNFSKSEITILAADDLENVQCAKREFYEKKERITLADLFLVDSDEYMPHTELDDKDQGDVLNEPKSTREADGTVSSKLKLPFAKKFIPLIKQEYSNSSSHSRGIKKIHKVSVGNENFISRNRGIIIYDHNIIHKQLI